MTNNSEVQAPGAFKPKKSVALSGVTAGNTALCTVGRTGNRLAEAGLGTYLSKPPSSAKGLTWPRLLAAIESQV